jgi:hypothetical protein
MGRCLLYGLGVLLPATAAISGQVSTYQVTVLEVKDDMIA